MFNDQYDSYQVSIAFFRNKQCIKRIMPEVANMRTAYSLADKMKKKLDADNYTVTRIATEEDMDKLSDRQKRLRDIRKNS